MSGTNTISAQKKIGKATTNGGADTADVENPNRQEEVDWRGKIAVISSIRSYDELAQYVNNNTLPAFNDEPNDAIAQQEINNLDMVALHHLPDDAPERIVPISVEGDGNCYLLYKTERRYMEIRV